MRKFKRFLAGLIALALIATTYSGLSDGKTVKADVLSCSYLTGYNIGKNNYTVRATPVYSYLVPLSSGYMRVQGAGEGEGFSVSYYDTEYSLTKRQVIAAELPKFGGFFATDSAYYIVTGQSNSEQKDDLEVFRVTKYDTSWNRIGSCGLYGANTTVPFNAGSCRMDIDGKYLIIRTCHTMYKSSDGLNHQANVTIEVDTSSMEVTDSYTRVMNSSVGYVSHSFNQFVKVENHSIVSVDHGDAYPRSVCFMKYSSDISDGKFQGQVNCIDVISFPGKTGTNSTGASVGGFELSDSNYLIAGNSVVQDDKNLERKTRNVFVATVNKSSNAVNVNWLTSYPEGEASATTPHMVKISNTGFMVLWTRDTKVYYVLVDGSGKAVSEIYSMDGELSDCVPVVSGGKLVWYTWENGIEKFYEISLSSPSDNKVYTVSFEHEYERASIKNNVVTLKCKKCGTKLTGNVVNGFKMYWKKSQDSGSYWSNIPSDIQKDDVILFLSNLDAGYSNEPEFSEMIIESNDPEHCITSWSEKKIYFTVGGTYNIKVYPKYNPEIAKIYEFTVGPVPTATPTAKPTQKPTATPTAKPTQKPTATPTAKPTQKPTATPTAKPTQKPTATPTATPTQEPTVTATPTQEPTVTATPTQEPTVTATPTQEPTVTATPTQEPTVTATPTQQPTVTPMPTQEPTITATPTPTAEATPTPVPTGDIEIEYSDGVTIETISYKENDKLSIVVKKTNSEEDVEEAEYVGIKGNSVKINSYYSEKKTVTIPEYVESKDEKYYIITIGKNILGYSDCIKTVKLGRSVSSIAKSAFKNERKLKRIEIYAENLSYVGKGAFKGIYSKAKIILIGTQEQCENARKLIVSSGIGKKVKIIFNIE